METSPVVLSSSLCSPVHTITKQSGAEASARGRGRGRVKCRVNIRVRRQLRLVLGLSTNAMSLLHVVACDDLLYFSFLGVLRSSHT